MQMQCVSGGHQPIYLRFPFFSRLPRPLKCPQNIYDNLMMPCWHKEPKERPDFGRLSQIINGLIAEYGESV